MAFDIYTVFVLYNLKIKIERESLTGGSSKNTFGSRKFWLELIVAQLKLIFLVSLQLLSEMSIVEV